MASMESALEEERREIMKLLEQAQIRESNEAKASNSNNASSLFRSKSDADASAHRVMGQGYRDGAKQNTASPNAGYDFAPLPSINKPGQRRRSSNQDRRPIQSMLTPAPYPDHALSGSRSNSRNTNNRSTSPPLNRPSSSSVNRPTSPYSCPPAAKERPFSTDSLDLQNAYRRLSDEALARSGGHFANLPARHARNDSISSRLQKDSDAEHAIESSSSDSDTDSDPDLTHQRNEYAAGNRREAQSMLAAVEDERKVVSARRPVRSLLSSTPDPKPPSAQSHGSTSDNSRNKQQIHPSTNFDSRMSTPFSSDNEAEVRDLRHAESMKMRVEPCCSSVAKRRVVQHLYRGDYETVSKTVATTREYLVASDLSAEATHALEWTIGTVMRDGDTLYAVYIAELPEKEVTEAQMERERLDGAEQIVQLCSKLLRRTRLQVHLVVEVIHAKAPKHMLNDMIDFRDPTLVVLGSRGRSALKGYSRMRGMEANQSVLLGSISNYIVSKSSVPVMVARKKLKKTKFRGASVRLTNNLTNTQRSLSTAKVD